MLYNIIKYLSNVCQMHSQIAVKWNLEWNGIVQAYYIEYSIDG